MRDPGNARVTSLSLAVPAVSPPRRVAQLGRRSTTPLFWTHPPCPPPFPFDYEAALAECAKGDRAALHRIYQHESRRLLGVALHRARPRAPRTCCTTPS